MWSYESSAGTSLSLLTLTPGNGLAVKTTDQTGNDTVTRFDGSGNGTMLGGNATSTSYSWQGFLNGFANGGFATIMLPFVPVNTVSNFAEPGGSPSSNGGAVVHHSLGLFWCGSALAAQGYYPGTNSPCVQGAGHDVSWGYYPLNAGVSASRDFSSTDPTWVGVILGQALKAFQKAYLNYGIQVNLATQTGGTPDQEFTAFVLGDNPYPTAGQRFLSTPYSGVYYYYFMENAQLALGQPENPNGSGWINFSPALTQTTPQAAPDFLSLMSAIGTAIGNAAAHEMGHQLEQITNIKSNNLKGLPYMDCGLGNPGDQNRPVPIPCENNASGNNDNFVYGFYTADGYPQDPNNPKSTGGMFFYGVPGGQSGVPVQPAIHWGPSDICWLQNYANPGSCTQ